VSLNAALRDYRMRAESSLGVSIAIAADFLHGGQPSFARLFDRRGAQLATLRRATNEPWASFRDRVKGVAAETTGAASLVIGGLPDTVRVRGENDFAGDGAEPPRGARGRSVPLFRAFLVPQVGDQKKSCPPPFWRINNL
jgi:hypothetical protein